MHGKSRAGLGFLDRIPKKILFLRADTLFTSQATRESHKILYC
jgi:hypothetical protein